MCVHEQVMEQNVKVFLALAWQAFADRESAGDDQCRKQEMYLQQENLN